MQQKPVLNGIAFKLYFILQNKNVITTVFLPNQKLKRCSESKYKDLIKKRLFPVCAIVRLLKQVAEEIL